MSVDYILSNLQKKGDCEIHLSTEFIKNKGSFRKHHIPWNKGMSWDEMGISKEKQKVMRKNLEKYQGKGNPNMAGWNARPVIAMDAYGDQKHWYKSASEAARRLGLIGRNIRRACVKGYYCGDFRWKFDERFKIE